MLQENSVFFVGQANWDWLETNSKDELSVVLAVVIWCLGQFHWVPWYKKHSMQSSLWP